MASNGILPPNSTALERAAAAVGTHELPVPLRDLWNPDACPEALLPWLAWSRSVDRWDPEWPVSVKRAVINNARSIHRRKGTNRALQTVIEPFGYVFDVIEWWQEEPPGPPGTFRINLSVSDKGITDELYDQMSRLIDDAKPVSRHLVNVAISLQSLGAFGFGAATYLGDELVVYPWFESEVTTTGAAGFAGAEHSIDTMSVYP
jgi:phage tail P2-like protein